MNFQQLQTKFGLFFSLLFLIDFLRRSRNNITEEERNKFKEIKGHIFEYPPNTWGNEEIDFFNIRNFIPFYSEIDK